MEKEKSKKVKRYTLVIKNGLETRRAFSEKELLDLKSSVNNYNSNKNNPFFLGDIQVSGNIVTFVKYKKVSVNATLKDIDEFTISFNNDYELKTVYGLDTKDPRKILVAYRAEGEIKTLPVIYKKNKVLLDYVNLNQVFLELSKNEEFLTSLLRNKLIETSSKNAIDEFDLLYAQREYVKYGKTSTTLADNFFRKFTTNKGELNYLHLRLLADLVIEFLLKEESKKEEEEKETEVFGQMCLCDYAMQDLKEEYEQLKIMTSDGSFQDIYRHKLIPPKNN